MTYNQILVSKNNVVKVHTKKNIHVLKLKFASLDARVSDDIFPDLASSSPDIR